LFATQVLAPDVRMRALSLVTVGLAHPMWELMRCQGLVPAATAT